MIGLGQKGRHKNSNLPLEDVIDGEQGSQSTDWPLPIRGKPTHPFVIRWFCILYFGFVGVNMDKERRQKK